MAARLLLLIAWVDLLQAWRQLRSLGWVRIVASIVAGAALVLAESWIAWRLTSRLLTLPPPISGLAEAVLLRGAALVTELALMIATASAVTLAVPAIEGVEVDPWAASSPLPRVGRALQVWWRVLAGLGWVAVLALPPLLTIGLEVRPGVLTAARQVTGMALLLGGAAAVGTLIALSLAALIPRRVLVPLSWSATTAAVVGAVLWLRHLHPEQLVTMTDPTVLLTALAGLGAEEAGPIGSLAGAVVGTNSMIGLVLASAAALAGVVALWGPLARRAAFRMSGAPAGQARPWITWRLLDRLVGRGGVGVLVSSRLRLVARDLAQASQTLYLLGLGAVYVENLRALPLSDPLARELAGLVNLAMAGLLAAAMALRFAYPAHLLEGEATWWWATAPVSRLTADTAATLVAVVPPLALSTGLLVASAVVTGWSRAATTGWWLVPWQALWLTVLGVTLGPRAPDPRHGSWVDAALGGGGLVFLAVAVGGVGWTVLAAGRQVVSEVLRDFDVAWRPGLLTGNPLLAATVLTVATVAVVGWTYRKLTPAA